MIGHVATSKWVLARLRRSKSFMRSRTMKTDTFKQLSINHAMDKNEKKRLKVQFKANELAALMASLDKERKNLHKAENMEGSIGIQLRHNRYRTENPINEIIKEAIQNRENELILAISLPFDGNEYDFDWSDTEGYDEYFDECAKEISAELGLPVYRGKWSDELQFEKWMSRVCPNGHADELSVWTSGSILVYLRTSYFDKEAPILIAFGAAGCKRDGEFEYMDCLNP